MEKAPDPAQFATLRQEATDPAFHSPFLNEHRAGIFSCAGCNFAGLFVEDQIRKRTGWPSYWAALPNATRTSTDNLLGFSRVEEHCRVCGGHLAMCSMTARRRRQAALHQRHRAEIYAGQSRLAELSA